jgi:chromate reductase, NAD(P)H dehydrogenase (quinone)
MKILAFAGSLRRDSLNKKLLTIASDIARKKGVEVMIIDLAEFEMPLYSGDIEDKQGAPIVANKLKELFNNVDGVIISAPEYNFSVSGVLKNALDWVSRTKPQPFKQKHILLMSASPSMVGGNRGLWSLRMPLEALGAFVYPDMFSLSVAHEAFDAKGGLKDTNLYTMLDGNVDGFIKHVSKTL